MSRPVFKEQLWKSALRVILVSVNVFVLLLCLAVFATGLWARLSEESYVGITGKASLTRMALAVAAVGLCASLVALLGILGALLLKSILGQVVLSVYAVVLIFLIVTEVAAGVAAIQYRDGLEERIENSTNHSLYTTYSNPYNTSNDWNKWDRFQQNQMCCGAENYTEFFSIFQEDVVPRSCCTYAAKRRRQCTGLYKSVTPEDVTDIHTKPCLSVIVPELRETMLTLAIVAIVIGSFQALGVVFSAIMIYAAVRGGGEKNTQSYQKLWKRTRGSSEYYST